MEREVVKANAVVFVSSFCTLVIELVAGRILAPYLGVSLYTWTSIIGVVLAGISVGAYLGGLLADRHPSYTTLGWLLFLSGLGAFTIAPLTNLLGGYRFETNLMARILIITTLIFFVPSCLLGMISPVVVKLTLRNLNRTGNVVGKIYAFSTLGSILGTFATGFFLISWMGTRLILFSMGAILIISAVVFGNFLFSKRLLALLFALFIPLAWTFYDHAFRMPVDRETYVFKESNYYTIQVKKCASETHYNRLEALTLDHLIHSYTDLSDPFHLEYEYIRIYEELLGWQVEEKTSFKTLFIGGGGYTFPRYLEARYPGAEIDVVEIDPEVTRIARTWLGIRGNSRIRSINEDARWFLMNCPDDDRYDFIFGDAFNDLSIPYHLTTKEFAALVKRFLKPDGILLANVIDDFRKGRFIPSYLRTLEEVFGRGHVHLVTSNPDFNDMEISTYVVMATAQDLNVESFAQTVPESTQKGRLSHIMSQSILQAYLQGASPIVLTDDYVPVDNLIAPVFEKRFGYRG